MSLGRPSHKDRVALSFEEADARTTSLHLGTPETCSACFDGDLSPLAPLRALRSLTVHRGAWSDDDLLHVARVRSLVSLDLSGSVVDARDRRDLALLAPLRRLESLRLSTIACCSPDPIGGFERLSALTLSFDARADDREGMFPAACSMARVGRCRSLRSLCFKARLGARDLALRHFGMLSWLERLDLSCDEAAEITDLAPLRDLTRLTHLNIRRTHAHDLSPLDDLRLLRASLPATISLASRLAFEARHPDCILDDAP